MADPNYNPDTDPIGRFNMEQARNDNQDFQQAQQDNTWDQTFVNTPPVDALRARVNLADTYNRVIGNRLALQAQSDTGALNLMQKQAQYQEYLRQAPLREQLLQARTAAAGGAQRFAAQKDAATQSDLSGFFDYMGKAPDVTDPNYKSYINSGVQKFPRILSTPAGADALKKLNQEHDDVSAVTPPAGMELAEVTHDENGRARATFKPIQNAPAADEMQPKPGFVVGHYVQDSQGKSHAVFVPDPALTAQNAATVKAQATQQKLVAADDNLVNGTLSFGHLDDKGKLVPDSAGGQATHVQSFYQDPVTGKRHDSPPITIKEFQAIQANVAARKAAAAQGAQGVPGPAAPAQSNPNQAALDWLEKNPNAPQAAAVRAKLGLK